ncbi:enterotoxin A family protein [Rurimicrobium arvi]
MYSNESASHPIHGEYTRNVTYKDPDRPVINDGTLKNIANLPSVSDYQLTARYGTPEPSMPSGAGLLNASGGNPMTAMGAAVLAAAVEESAAFALGEAIGYGLAATASVLLAPEVIAVAAVATVVVGTAALIDEYAKTKPLNPPAIPIAPAIPITTTVPDESQEKFLYRFDTRGPEEIMKEGGFRAWGTNMDLGLHAIGYSTHIADIPNSGYVSTSKSVDALIKSLPQGASGYIYTIAWQPTGIDVNATLGAASPHPEEQEVAVPLFIPFISIRNIKPFKN